MDSVMTVSNEEYAKDGQRLKAALDSAGIEGVIVSENGERLTADSLALAIVTKGAGQYLIAVCDEPQGGHDLNSAVGLITDLARRN